MEDRRAPYSWQPRLFSVAVLDSDEFLGDTLCDLLRNSGFSANAYYDVASFMRAHQDTVFDSYVLDFLADWPVESGLLDHLVASIRARDNGDVPIFILGNQVAPERTERLGEVLMRHQVRYLLRPVRAAYLVQQIGEALAKKAGL